VDKDDIYPTLVEDIKPQMNIPHIYASGGLWWIKNLYVEDNVGVDRVIIRYYSGASLVYLHTFILNGAGHGWVNYSIPKDRWDYLKGNKISIEVRDVNGNKIWYNYTHDIYSDLSGLWNSIKDYVGRSIYNAIRALITEYPGVAPLIVLGWAMGDSIWSNSIGGYIDILKNPMGFVEGIGSFLSALRSNGVLNTIEEVLGSVKKDIERKVWELVSGITDEKEREKIKNECFDMYVVGDIVGFVVSMALQPSGFASDLTSFIEKVGSNAGKLGEAFGEIADTIAYMKSLLKDVKSAALGKMIESSKALKNAVRDLIKAGKLGSEDEEALSEVARMLGKSAEGTEKELVDDISKDIEEGVRAEDVRDAVEDIREDKGIAGKPEKEKELLEAEEYAIKEAGLSGEKVKIFHDVLRRGLVSEADKTDREFLKKVAEYIKNWRGNPLDAEEHTAVKFLKAKGVNTEVSGHTIEDFAVLKEGVHYGEHKGWGWKHIWEEELRTRRFYNYYKGKYGGEALQRKILEDIENALRYGDKVEIDDVTVEFRWGKIRVRVSISENNMGSIQTAFPKTRG